MAIPKGITLELISNIHIISSVNSSIFLLKIDLIRFFQMQFVAESNRWTKFISMQNLYNLLCREEEREMVPLCKDMGVTLVPYSPLAQGALARSADETEFKTGREYINSKWIDPENTSRVAVRKAVEEIAKKYNVSNAQVAIAWLLAKGACPIVGVTRKPEQLVDTVNALSLKLTEEDIQTLQKGYLPQEAKVYLA